MKCTKTYVIVKVLIISYQLFDFLQIYDTEFV